MTAVSIFSGGSETSGTDRATEKPESGGSGIITAVYVVVGLVAAVIIILIIVFLVAVFRFKQSPKKVLDCYCFCFKGVWRLYKLVNREER